MDTTQPNFEPSTYKSRINLEEVAQIIEDLKATMATIIVGQDNMVNLLMTALLSDGHVLLEGVPGVAKTLAAKTLSKLIDADFSRLQFTPDLMPSDVVGTNIFNQQSSKFEFKKGPIFGNIVLIDEINRAPAKTQAALFEVMEERQITSDGITYKMDEPFMVIATQNPIEHEGTYRLPEAQLDRFLLKINVDYPSQDEEVQILQNHHQQDGKERLHNLNAIMSRAQIDFCRSVVKQVLIEGKLLNYIAQIVNSTRNNADLYLGASPRASIALLNAAKATAILKGRDFVIPDDISDNVVPVLRHRIALTPEKEMEGLITDDVIKDIVSKIEVPR